LGALPAAQWDTHLRKHSGLPGARANLELAEAAADVGDEPVFRRWLGSGDEYLPLCGAIGIGRLVAEGRDDLWRLLRDTADDQRWRVREGVAMGLQRVGDADVERLLDEVDTWVDGSPLRRRAAVAGVCEPRLLRNPAAAERAVALVGRVTETLLEEKDRRDTDVRTLRQALGYCWSVAVAADPVAGVRAFRRLEAIEDPDAQWIVRENRRKKRLATLLA
jgi:hypothetical protein